MRYLIALAALAASLLVAGSASSQCGPGFCNPPPPPPGTFLELTNQTWDCDQPLEDYGPLPITVTQHWTMENAVEFGVRIEAGCEGLGNTGPAQLILHSDADGVHGPYGDAVRVVNAQGPHDLVIGGDAACGRGRAGNHQDGLQAIGGTNITFLDFDMKLGQFGGPSCQGAGGAAFYSSAQNLPVNMQILGGTWYGCNTGLRAGGGSGQSGHVQDAVIRNGFDQSGEACRDSEGNQYNSGPTCIFDDTSPITITHENVTCDKWPWEG